MTEYREAYYPGNGSLEYGKSLFKRVEAEGIEPGKAFWQHAYKLFEQEGRD